MHFFEIYELYYIYLYVCILKYLMSFFITFTLEKTYIIFFNTKSTTNEKPSSAKICPLCSITDRCSISLICPTTSKLCW